MLLYLCALLVSAGCEGKMRKKEIYISDKMKGILSNPITKPETILVALHGVGSNERDLVEVAEAIAPDSLVISLRSPIELSNDSYAFFHVQFTPSGPVHNWTEAKKNFELLEKELISISKRFNIPLKNISIMGFSQGSIMTMGLLLQSSLDLGHYICFSGRTLPEFADYAIKNPTTGFKRKIFLAHGVQDNTLPVSLGRRSKEVLEAIKADLTYLEFEGGHGITQPIIKEAHKWLISK